jgi:hypothetical protein
MPRRDKLLDRMRRNPRGDWTIENIAAVCRRFRAGGVTFVPPRRGSHYTVRHAAIEEILTIPAHRPIKAIYVSRFVDMIDRVMSLKEESDG